MPLTVNNRCDLLDAVRAKVNPEKKNKPQAISLPPQLKKFASKRAFDSGISLSRYFQLLAELDKTENVLARAMVSRLKTSSPAL